MVETGKKAYRRVFRALKASTSNYYRIAGVLLFSIMIFLVFAFTTDIPWHLQTLESGFQYWDDAFLNGVAGIYIGGSMTFLLTILYSVTGGFALTNMIVQLRYRGVATKGLGGLLPGFVATGCASCGVGVIGMLGISGAAAVFPLGGDLFKLGGILIMVYSLYEFGDPEICEA